MNKNDRHIVYVLLAGIIWLASPWLGWDLLMNFTRSYVLMWVVGLPLIIAGMHAWDYLSHRDRKRRKRS